MGKVKGAAGRAVAIGREEARHWLKQKQGHALQIAQELEGEAGRRPQQAEELRREAGYFRNNARRMNYMEMREEGWVIGSGAVESGVKPIKERFAGAGMRWSRTGAERLLPVRTAVMSHRFDQIWSELYALP